MSNTLETTIKQKLGIKFVDAKNLLAQAKEACEIANDAVVPSDRFDEVLEEACELFADLDEATQENMRASASAEPEWKKRARAVCEKREAEFQSKLNAEAQNEAVRDAMRATGASEEEVNRTTVTSVRAVGSPEQEEPKKGSKLTVRRHTCYCVVQ